VTSFYIGTADVILGWVLSLLCVWLL